MIHSLLEIVIIYITQFIKLTLMLHCIINRLIDCYVTIILVHGPFIDMQVNEAKQTEPQHNKTFTTSFWSEDCIMFHGQKLASIALGRDMLFCIIEINMTAEFYPCQLHSQKILDIYSNWTTLTYISVVLVII